MTQMITEMISENGAFVAVNKKQLSREDSVFVEVARALLEVLKQHEKASYDAMTGVWSVPFDMFGNDFLALLYKQCKNVAPSTSEIDDCLWRMKNLELISRSAQSIVDTVDAGRIEWELLKMQIIRFELIERLVAFETLANIKKIIAVFGKPLDDKEGSVILSIKEYDISCYLKRELRIFEQDKDTTETWFRDRVFANIIAKMEAHNCFDKYKKDSVSTSTAKENLYIFYPQKIEDTFRGGLPCKSVRFADRSNN
jgi:hypothetical protein